jgi:hypothetical protein
MPRLNQYTLLASLAEGDCIPILPLAGGNAKATVLTVASGVTSAADAEFIRDTMGVALIGGGATTVIPDDVNNTILINTPAASPNDIMDAANPKIIAGTNIVKTFNATTRQLTLEATGGAGSLPSLTGNTGKILNVQDVATVATAQWTDPTPFVVRPRVANQITIPHYLTASGNGASAVNTITAYPIIISSNQIVTGICAHQAANTTAGDFRIGLYANSRSSVGDQPGVQLEASPAITVSNLFANDIRSYTFPLPRLLTPGIYWLALTAGAAVVLTLTSASGNPLGVFRSGGANTPTRSLALTRNATFAALPADESAATYANSTGTPPFIGLIA